ncbi:hypothetical protein PILCRDRAFT_130025 [Piloderma croceum F 1598]|uniref:Uncharacterized protein n=1 Tax=Piloderma croceum (strain F 1598) TaxID=765440 RepID=A0A0C3GLJ5_PILCF|nr:hypothetical protein PILCRDRAFT_130025 [Piloderma croceum F 1598]
MHGRRIHSASDTFRNQITNRLSVVGNGKTTRPNSFASFINWGCTVTIMDISVFQSGCTIFFGRAGRGQSRQGGGDKFIPGHAKGMQQI